MYYWGGFTIILNISTKNNLIELDLNVFEEKKYIFFKVSGFFKE